MFQGGMNISLLYEACLLIFMPREHYTIFYLAVKLQVFYLFNLKL